MEKQEKWANIRIRKEDKNKLRVIQGTLNVDSLYDVITYIIDDYLTKTGKKIK